MKRVVVIGGGFSGAIVAKKLENSFNVTLIDTKNYFEFTPSVLKTIIEPKHSKAIEVVHKDYLKKATIIKGEVKTVSDNEIIVSNNKKKKIKFDYLVIASGSKYNSPIKENNLFVSSRTGTFKKAHNEIDKAKNILIIGGGLVGTELAAEICTNYDCKNITIVHSKEYLMERQPKKARGYAESFLRDRGVKIIFNERAEKKKGTNYMTDGKTKIKTDVAFLCTGISSNSEFMKENFNGLLNERNQIKVNSHLQVLGKENIFAAGDVTSIKEEKTAQNAEKQGHVVAENIIRLSQGRGLRKYDSEQRVMVISLGKFNGILTYNGFSFTGIIPGIMKKLIELKTMWRYKFS